MINASATVPKAVGALAVLLTAFPTTAAVITDEASFNEFLAQGHNTFGIDEDLLLDLFDPLLGTLQSVSLTFVTSLTDQSIIMSAICANQASCNISSERHVRTQDQFRWELGGSESRLFGEGVQSPDITCSGVAACVNAGPLPDVRNSYDLFFDLPADLALFQGPGAFQLNYQLFGTSCGGSIVGSFEGTCTYMGNLSMAATVAYSYIEAIPEPEPPVAVPEPGVLTLLGLGLAAAMFIRRRGKRC